MSPFAKRLSSMLLKMIRHRKLLKYCFEALVDLTICKCLVLCVPFHKYAAKYGHAHSETLFQDMHPAKDEIHGIKCALRVVPSYLPWQSKCLDQAMAAQRMLKRRGLQSTLYFGMVKTEEGSFKAHAWLRSGNCWIIGFQPHIPYTIVGTYASFH